MKNNNVKLMTFTGMFAALIFLTTYLHIPTGINGGYIHVGDALIYLAAVMLPLPNAMIAGAVGAGLSDFATPGAAVWIIPTVLIKSLCCLPFTGENDNLLCKRNVAAMFIAGLITTVGYTIAAAVISGGFGPAIAETPFFIIQSIGSAICFSIIAAALGKTGLKSLVMKGDKP